MISYVFTLDCETCGEPMRNRHVDLTADPDAELVIDLAMALSQVEFNCLNCGGSSYLGDVEDNVHHEPGEEHDEEGDGS